MHSFVRSFIHSFVRSFSAPQDFLIELCIFPEETSSSAAGGSPRAREPPRSAGLFSSMKDLAKSPKGFTPPLPPVLTRHASSLLPY